MQAATEPGPDNDDLGPVDYLAVEFPDARIGGEPDRKGEAMGLLKAAATVAVASSVHGRVQRRQQARWAAQDERAAAWQAPPPPPQPQASATPAQAGDMTEVLANLTKLGELKATGLLTEAEFEQQKARILGGG